jgi:hypothetical protein
VAPDFEGRADFVPPELRTSGLDEWTSNADVYALAMAVHDVDDRLLKKSLSWARDPAEGWPFLRHNCERAPVRREDRSLVPHTSAQIPHLIAVYGTRRLKLFHRARNLTYVTIIIGSKLA